MFRALSWKGLALLAILGAVLIWHIVVLVLVAVHNPGLLRGLPGQLLLGAIFLWLMWRLTRTEVRAERLEKRVVALEKFRDLATAAGVEQEQELREHHCRLVIIEGPEWRCGRREVP